MLTTSAVLRQKRILLRTIDIAGTAGREPARPGETDMHLLVLMILAAAVTSASPQTSTPNANPPPSSDQSSPTDLSAHQQHIEQQPQGSTGPLDTTSGGALAEVIRGERAARDHRGDVKRCRRIRQRHMQ